VTPDATLKHVLRELDPAAREFYRRLANGDLATTFCPACERYGFPPRERCALCGGTTEWRPLSGRGSVYAYTQQERGLRFIAPQAIGIVGLDEGVRVFGLFEDPIDRLAVGLPVQVRPRADEAGLTLLAFTLANP
jgi:uncharacterized OB-fold protein